MAIKHRRVTNKLGNGERARDGVSFTCNGKGYTVRLSPKWNLTPHEVKSMNSQAAHYVDDYTLI